MDHPDHLPRLHAPAYQGRAWVHWSMGITNRAQGWLNPMTHAAFRELLLHSAFRYHLHCPAYCLMPDHVHLLWMGTSASSDQKLAMRFLRRHLNPVLASHRVSLQPQAYDRVLRRDEMSGDSFEDMVLYIRKNPERAGLVKAWQDWAFGGAMVPGYPELPIYPAADFWHRFWTIYHKEVRRQENLRKGIPREEDGSSERPEAH